MLTSVTYQQKAAFVCITSLNFTPCNEENVSYGKNTQKEWCFTSVNLWTSLTRFLIKLITPWMSSLTSHKDILDLSLKEFMDAFLKLHWKLLNCTERKWAIFAEMLILALQHLINAMVVVTHGEGSSEVKVCSGWHPLPGLHHSPIDCAEALKANVEWGIHWAWPTRCDHNLWSCLRHNPQLMV